MPSLGTSTQEPIYSKSYPYPANMRGEMENQVDELLREGIIRHSKSPYNSKIWEVPKKPKPKGEKQYRMVINFNRLNAVTISDTYPIPDITSTLSSLGEAKLQRSSGQTDRRTDRQTDMARSTRLVILIMNIYTLWGRKRFLLPVTYFPTNLVYPFTLRVTGINIQQI